MTKIIFSIGLLFTLCSMTLSGVLTPDNVVFPTESVSPDNPREPEVISSVAWSPNGSKIAVGYETSYCMPEHPEFYNIKIFNSELTEQLQTLTGSLCNITSIDWSPDGSRLAASSSDSVGTRVWNTRTGQLIMIAQEGGQGITEVRWQPPTGLHLADSSVSGGIGILNVNTGETIGLARFGGTTLDWSPDGSQLVSASAYENTVYIADMIIGQQIMALEGHTGAINSVDWSPDGTKLASGGGLDDPSIRVWDAVTGQNLHVLHGHTTAIREVRWSPDSSRFASTSSDGTLRVWDGSSGVELVVFHYPGRVYAVDWSPDGSQLVYGGLRSDGQDATLEIVEMP